MSVFLEFDSFRLMKQKKLLILFSLVLVCSCADYRYQKQDNPFAQYGIKSLTVPMFYNHSNFSNVSASFTKEVFQMLAGFKGLRIESGKKSTDATLIGIISSSDGLRDSRRGDETRAVKSIFGDEFIEGRNDFFVPSRNSLYMNLRIIVMKHPTEEEIKFLKSGIGEARVISSKIIFTEVIPVTASFTREIFSGAGNKVIGTQNRGAEKKTIKTMAKNAAVSFRDMILYAF